MPTNVSLLHRVIEAKLVRTGVVGSDTRVFDPSKERLGLDEGRTTLAHSPIAGLKDGRSPGLVIWRRGQRKKVEREERGGVKRGGGR